MANVWTPRDKPGHKAYQMDEGVVRQKRFTLTSAEILALYTTAQEIVPAPGKGKYLEFVSATLFLNHGGTDYANGGNLSFQINSVDVCAVIGNTALVNSAADACVQTTATATAFAVAEDTAMNITNAGAAHITGNGTISGLVTYRVVDFSTED